MGSGANVFGSRRGCPSNSQNHCVVSSFAARRKNFPRYPLPGSRRHRDAGRRGRRRQRTTRCDAAHRSEARRAAPKLAGGVSHRIAGRKAHAPRQGRRNLPRSSSPPTIDAAFAHPCAEAEFRRAVPARADESHDGAALRPGENVGRQPRPIRCIRQPLSSRA